MRGGNMKVGNVKHGKKLSSDKKKETPKKAPFKMRGGGAAERGLGYFRNC